MKKITLLVLLLPSLAFAWWNDTGLGMPDLMDAGYTLVGYEALPGENAVYGGVTKHFFIFQKGKSLAFCYEHTGFSGQTIATGCLLSTNSD